jgi:hypothetical protein
MSRRFENEVAPAKQTANRGTRRRIQGADGERAVRVRDGRLSALGLRAP